MTVDLKIATVRYFEERKRKVIVLIQIRLKKPAVDLGNNKCVNLRFDSWFYSDRPMTECLE